VAATKSVASKINATLMAKFGTKMNLSSVGQDAKELWHTIVVFVSVNQIAVEETVA
jgi:hypothetical protein